MAALRVALFTDSFHETNGLGTLCRQYVTFAQERDLPLLCVCGGPATRVTRTGGVERLQLRRGVCAFHVDADVLYDPLFFRHVGVAVERLRAFRPDLVHITGPGDVSLVGVCAASLLGVPTVATWHTNFHEYAQRRVEAWTGVLPRVLRNAAASAAGAVTLRTVLSFYRTCHFLAAPNQSMADALAERTKRPTFLMAHGVDTSRFVPGTENRGDRPFTIGYVGRLSPEKNVRALVEVERQLLARGESGFRFSVVGDGSEREWLRRHMRTAEFPGLLHGPALAAAFAGMDAFVFPSLTDTFGLVILEAMSAGVPVIVSPATGARAGVVDGVDGFYSDDFAASLQRLMHDSDTRVAMGKAARAHACARSWPGVFDDLYRIYHEGLAAEQTRRRMPTPRYDRAPSLTTLWR